MYHLKGFVSINSGADNRTGITAPVGELSAYASTFAREVKSYAHSGSDTTFFAFFSKSTVASALQPPTVLTNKVLAIAEWVKARQPAVNGQDTIANFISNFTAIFGATCTNPVVTAMVVDGNGKLWPADLSWQDSDFAEVNTCRIWFSDEHFTQQYDEYEIVVVPPLPLAQFFNDYTLVDTTLSAITFAEKLAALQTYRARAPETVPVGLTFKLVNKLNPAVSRPTEWTFLVYGPRGNDQDLIRQALLDYIAVNDPAHSQAQWDQIFPDISKSTEFLIIPMWADYAIAPLTLVDGVHSPVVKLGAMLTRMKTLLPQVSGAHIDAYAESLVHPYRSLQMGIIGSATNRESKFSIRDIFADVLMVSSTSTDFGLMRSATQGFLMRFYDLCVLAETITSVMDVPTSYRKITRDGILYVSFNYANATFMMATKASVPA